MLHFLSYLNTEMAQVVEIIPHGRHMFYHGHWYPSSSRGHNISIYVIDQFVPNILVPVKESLEYSVSINEIVKIWSQLNTGTIKSMCRSAWILPLGCLKSPGKVLEFHFWNSVLTLISCSSYISSADFHTHTTWQHNFFYVRSFSKFSLHSQEDIDLFCQWDLDHFCVNCC